MSADQDITDAFDKIFDFFRTNVDPEIEPEVPAEFEGDWIEYLINLLYGYVHGHAELIREYMEKGRPPHIKPGPGTVWYIGGLEKAADIIDPYKRPEVRG